MNALKVAAVALALATNVVSAQSQNMMDGGGLWNGAWMGGYGGTLGTLLLVFLVAALVVWIIQKSGKD